jgi:hypothetical protein
MKSMKKETLILGVVIIALLGYLLLRKTNRVHYDIPTLDTVKVEDIDKIEIKKADKTIVLMKKEDNWVIEPNGYPTDKTKIDNITKNVAGLTLTDLASRSKNYTRYDLLKDKSIAVKAFQKDKVLRDYEIGKVASTYGHTFVKIKDDENVYYARESFRNHFDVKLDDLRDKSVMKVDTNEISQLEFTSEGKSYLLSKDVKKIEPAAPEGQQEKDGKKEAQPVTPTAPQEEINWILPDGKKGKKAQVDSLIKQFTDLSCQEYIEGKTKEDFASQAPLYTLRLKGSKDFTLTIFPKSEAKGDDNTGGSGNYPAISSENPYPFFLTSWKAEQIMKKPEDIIEGMEKKEEKK